jgi:hypothetical protein
MQQLSFAQMGLQSLLPKDPMKNIFTSDLLPLLAVALGPKKRITSPALEP